MRILVTGPRQWTDLESLQAGLDQAAGPAWPLYAEAITLVHGNAGGFDRMAGAEASARGWAVEKHEARWYSSSGRIDLQAGHKRNQHMVSQGPYDACLAGIMPCVKPSCFTPQPHSSHGTMDCVSRVLLAGIPLIPVRPHVN